MHEHKENKVCDICKRRPAVLNVVIIHNGIQTVLDLCEYDYFSINLPALSGSKESREESIRSFNDYIYSMSDSRDSEGIDSPQYGNLSDMSESFGIDGSLSQSVRQTLEEAGTTAITFGRTVVDTEHLLYALLDDRIVNILMDILNVDPEELKKALSMFSLKGDFEDIESMTEIPISPNVSEILQKASVISAELGSRAVEPEHVLISICENSKTLPGSLLVQSGVTSSKLKRPELRVLR
jgi:ATP-dependent Clp protease ATP-binding subunit ClpC